MWAAVVALTVVPLIWVGHGPVDETGTAGELFEGADSRAQQAITRIAPDYQPWFHPVLEPSSNEIASLLFALQAAVGAGVIGYWLGVSKARARVGAASAQGPAPADSGAPLLHGTPGTPGAPEPPGPQEGAALLAAPPPGSAPH
ncbi:cobalt ABC transporter substrate-binding protein CbiN [Roseateles terrae]|nr:energy-coupling factor ABC transporter substrate-binding protein [Roseateles terrae]OWQ86740.1 cobalt ABC transporter substrate-binding protein CbiN [Roseateles terrae]